MIHRKGIFVFISIHALVKRATLSIVLVFVKQKYFNPRPREEGDGLYRHNAD